MYKMLKMIFFNLGNDIHSNCEAGIDIRKNADPIVQVSLSLYVRYNTKSDWMSN